jgi:uncharacterized protein YutE (UPF0331/DUF86 family)
MSVLDREVLAERAQAVERHLARVARRLPGDASAFAPASDASDSVILHLWQATQIVIDLAVSACLHFRLGAPSDYGDAFRRLHSAGILDEGRTDRLVRAAGFRNVVAHAYEHLDMARVYRAALDGPPDLRAFLAALRDALARAGGTRG